VTGAAARLRQRLARRDPLGQGEDPSLIWAAVAAVLTPEPDSLLLIRRADRTGDPWSGHMGLPGGRREPGDPDLLTTAIRETAEELGIELAPTDLAGHLEDVVPRTPSLPPIGVRPFVFYLAERPPLMPNAEVAEASWVPLHYLLRPDIHHSIRLEVGGQHRMVDAYRLENAIVWGMTERILTDLLGRLEL